MQSGEQDDDRIMELVEAALALPVPQRESYLRKACGSDVALFTQALHYVRNDERMQGFLLEPLIDLNHQEAEHPFAPDQLLLGRFRIVAEIAQGGMGIVYQARDEKLGKRIAIKCAKARFSKRLPEEVRHATAIAHPNVCRIFEIHSAMAGQEEIEFLTMEYLEGQTLAERLELGPLSESERHTIARQICAGLAEAHRRQVVHGDLKTNNIILAEDEGGPLRAVITDFGLAHHTGGAQPSEVGGDLGYMAPELLIGAKPTVASDIYALGAILSRMAGGGWRSGWDRMVSRCLSPRPEQRFSSAADVAAALPVSRRQLVMGLAASIAALTIAAAAMRMVPAKDDPALAVLPFVNESATPEGEYLADGVTEGLIHALAQFPNLRVITRGSSLRLKQSSDARAAARKLGVRFLVSGRVLEAGGRRKIAVALEDAAQGTNVWGVQYDVSGPDLAGLEITIAYQIAEQAGSKATESARQRLSKSTRVKPEAYEMLLRGRYQIRLYTPASRQKAIGYFEQALALDPQFALAHAELANAYRLLAGGGIADPAESLRQAKAEAQRALAADADLAEGHAAMADVLKDLWDWAGAETEYRRAIDLNPNLANAHMGYGILLSIRGRYGDALTEAAKVRQLDPIGIPGAIHAAAVHYNNRRYAEAIAELDRALRLDPSSPSPWMWKGMVYGGSGAYGEANRAYRKAIELGDDTAATQCFYAYSLARSGDRDHALAILARLDASRRFVPVTALAVAQTGLGNHDQAIALLQSAYSRADPILQYLKAESHFDSLQHSREYTQLAAQLGLP